MATKYEKELAAYAARRSEIVKLHGTGRWTYKEIGLKVKPQISAQRVRQILVQEGVKQPLHHMRYG